jgi:hypothetical protein
MTSRNELELDAKTLLPLKFRTLLRNHANPQIVSSLEYTYSDYRQDGPYVLPHSISMTANGEPHSTVTFESIEINAGFSASTFDLVQK